MHVVISQWLYLQCGGALRYDAGRLSQCLGGLLLSLGCYHLKRATQRLQEACLLRSEQYFPTLPGSAPGCRTGNGEKLSRTQAEPVQAIKSAVAYFPSISGATSWRRSRYTCALECSCFWSDIYANPACRSQMLR